MSIDLEQFGLDLRHLLQEADEDRPLDSIEMVVVNAALCARGIELPKAAWANVTTIKGWMECLRNFSTAG